MQHQTPYPQPQQPQPGIRQPRQWSWFMWIIVAFVVGILVGAVAAGARDDGTPTADNSAEPAPADAEPDPIVEEPATTEPALAEPAVDFSATCDYVLGDFTENAKTGYRFIADVSLDNTGNIGAVTEVTAVWYLSGGDKITKKEKVKVGYHATGKRVGFEIPASQDDIDRHQSATGETCKVDATIVDVYGSAQ